MISLPDFQEKQIIFAFLGNGEKVSFSNDNIVIKDSEGKVKHKSTCYRLFILFIVGETTITTGLLQRARKFNFSIVFMTVSLKVYGQINSVAEGNVLLKSKQYKYDQNDIGTHIIKNKILNEIITLKKIRQKSELQKNAIEKLELFSNSLTYSNMNLNLIMGIEGTAAKEYFKAFFEDYDWKKRMPRVKNDMINFLLDMGYSIMFNIIEGITNNFGFDIYVGVLHRQFYMRKSLICDLIEPFRCIVDESIKKGINLKQFSEDDFLIYNGKYTLEWKYSKKYTTIIASGILEYKDEIFKYVQSYYRCFAKEFSADKFPVFRLE